MDGEVLEQVCPGPITVTSCLVRTLKARLSTGGALDTLVFFLSCAGAWAGRGSQNEPILSWVLKGQIPHVCGPATSCSPARQAAKATLPALTSKFL